MNLLDRYIFKSVFFTCLAAVGMFAFIVVVPNIARDLVAHALAGQLPPLTLLKLISLLVPVAIVYALPMGMLTGVLLTLGRLSADSEITAMRAAGVSVPRATRPVVLLGVLGAAVGLYFNFDSMPRARVAYESTLAAAIRSNPLSIIVPKTFIRDFPGYVVYVNDKEGGLLHDFWLWELDKDRRVVRVVRAESGRVDYDDTNNEFILTLTHAQVESRREKAPENFTDAQLVGAFGQWGPIHLSLERFFGRGSSIRVKREWLTYDQLEAERQRLAQVETPAAPEEAERLAQDRIKADMVYHDKFNTALAVLSFAMIGIPLGIKVSRRETSANFGVAVGLTLVYYLMTVVIKVLDRHPEVRPDLLLWLPNAIYLGAAIWLMRRVERR
ncbi:MAG TPA: LptF/LptG family permease [Opitutus sp.]|nr:LptF/LptG family permease [Opitutus sp.]